MTTSQISIRTARQDDYADLWRVATLDSALVHEGPLLVAESDGEIVAALSLTNGGVIADPFRRTAAAVDLLRLRGGQLRRSASGSPHGLLSRLRGRSAALHAAQ
jgi:hypothetical protein